MLAQQPDLLLLDEPTNHLDLAAIERLESFLAEYPGAFVLVSHDRAFIRAVCREIVELERRQVRPLPVRLRQVRRRARRAPRARARPSTSARRSTSTRPRTSSAATWPGRRPSRRRAGARCWRSWSASSAPTTSGSTPARSRSRFQTGGDLGGKETIRAPQPDRRLPGRGADPARRHRQHLPRRQGRHRRPQRQRQVDAAQDADRRAAAAAPARSRSAPASASATSIRSWARSTEDLSLIDEIRSVRADLSPEVVRQYLAKFRFFGDDPFRTVRGLSGGERSRLAMAKIMLFPRNVLVLDEPTNHLDIPARETLEDALGGYEGTLIVVSHDRYFLDRVCTRLLVIEGTARRGARRQLQRLAAARPRSEAVAEAAAPRAAAQARRRSRLVGRRGDARRRQGPRARAAPAGAPRGDTGGGCKQAGSGAGRRPRGAWRAITPATGRSCTPSPTANGSSTPCWPAGWPNGRPPAPRVSQPATGAPPIDKSRHAIDCRSIPACDARFGIARARRVLF